MDIIPGEIYTETQEARTAWIDILIKMGNPAEEVIIKLFVQDVFESAISGIYGGTQIIIKMPGDPPFQ